MNRQGARLASVGGHLVDLWKMVRFRYGPPHSYTKFRNIKRVAKLTGATQLIETGTYLGNTAMRCSYAFEKVYTIELDRELAAKSGAYLARRPNVEVVQGDALAELPKILGRPEVGRVLVFLDGHFSGGVTAHGDVPEPACEEIEVLGRHREKICGVVVDDFRCFGTDDGWPTKSALLHSVESHFNDGFEIMVHLDQVLVIRRDRNSTS